MVVSNAGPSDSLASAVTDALPAGLEACSWRCATDGGGACTAGPVVGGLSDAPDLPAGAAASYTLTCTLAADLDPQPASLLYSVS
ncbi:MAG: hypothetical protein AAGF23_23080, partial [Acidobacteriota bacterium]